MTDMTTQEVADSLSVSYQTVVNYTARQSDPLPVKHQQRQGLKTIRTFDSTDVQGWAERHGIPCNIDG